MKNKYDEQMKKYEKNVEIDDNDKSYEDIERDIIEKMKKEKEEKKKNKKNKKKKKSKNKNKNKAEENKSDL